MSTKIKISVTVQVGDVEVTHTKTYEEGGDNPAYAAAAVERAMKKEGYDLERVVVGAFGHQYGDGYIPKVIT